jgi:hypothetical protein
MKIHIMAEIEKRGKKDKKERAGKGGHHNPPTGSGVPSYGGSRQGNIGHQENESGDNAHS